uniref:SCP domain-containing protein n=1 Tax=Leersia perrieri TaxID=77586 RepID=A0A0D9WKL4_9ORYZ
MASSVHVVILLLSAATIILVHPAASFRIGINMGGNNNNQEQEHDQGGDESDGPGGLHSFTGGRGSYKFMAHEFLEAHNTVRARYGMKPLKWSNKLARYARRWAAARRFDCVLMHSPGSPYGENVFWGTGWDWRAIDAVKSWAGESNYYDWRAQTCRSGQECGHFTQVVWNDTELVGCGRSECVAGGVFITCSYEPPGNYKGEVPLTGYIDD